MINKYRIKIVQKELYNVRDPSWVKDRKNYRRNYCSNLNGICNCLQLTSLDPTESEFIHTNLSGFCLIIFQTYFIHCPIHQGLIVQSTFYKFVVLCSLDLYPFTYWVWASKHVPTYIYIYIYTNPVYLGRMTMHYRSINYQETLILRTFQLFFYTSITNNFVLLVYVWMYPFGNCSYANC